VYDDCRRKCFPRAKPGELTACQRPELVVDEREQPVDGTYVAAPPGRDQRVHIRGFLGPRFVHGYVLSAIAPISIPRALW
jgi:hypothetical protein